MIAAAAGTAAGWAVPALSQEGSSNPLAVTWEVDAPRVVDPLPFALSEETDADFGSVPIRMPLGADPGPSAAAGGWNGRTYFQDCVTDTECADAPGRVGLRVRSDGFGGVKLGALVRFGENLSSPRTGTDDAWRFFAAADAHALTWDFDRSDNEGVRLENQTLVGDAQVGISRPLAGGDLAFGFVHREVSAEGVSRNEQFGGITFSMSH